MKKTLLLLCLFVSTSFLSIAQLKKGVINYEMTFSSDDPQMAMISTMMQGSKMKTSFMPGKSRAEVSMGMLGNTIAITDQKSKKSLTLTDMNGAKYAVESTIETKTDEPEYTVEVTTETKEIAGYTCTKAILTTVDGSMIVWCTKEIQAYTEGQSFYNDKMPGFPLSIIIQQNGLTIEMTATSIEKKVSKKIFSMSIPEGYEIKTEEELKEMQMGQ
jgi:GLPGLI family protein